MRIKFTDMADNFNLTVRESREDCQGKFETDLYDLLAEVGGKCIQMGKTCCERLPEVGARLTAGTLAGMGGRDSSRVCIHRAARYLVSLKKSTWEYCTQTPEGSTLWKGPQGNSELISLGALDFYGF